MPRSIHDMNFNKIEPGDFIAYAYNIEGSFSEFEEVTKIVFDDPEDENRCAICTMESHGFILAWRWNPCIAKDFKVIKVDHHG